MPHSSYTGPYPSTTSPQVSCALLDSNAANSLRAVVAEPWIELRVLGSGAPGWTSASARATPRASSPAPATNNRRRECGLDAVGGLTAVPVDSPAVPVEFLLVAHAQPTRMHGLPSFQFTKLSGVAASTLLRAIIAGIVRSLRSHRVATRICVHRMRRRVDRRGVLRARAGAVASPASAAKPQPSVQPVNSSSRARPE